MDTILTDTLLLALAAVIGAAWVVFALPRMIEAQRRLALVRNQRRSDPRRRQPGG